MIPHGCTENPLFRKPPLYPSELRGREDSNCQELPFSATEPTASPQPGSANEEPSTAPPVPQILPTRAGVGEPSVGVSVGAEAESPAPSPDLAGRDAGKQLREEMFLAFHRDNPCVYRELVRRARWAAQRGAKRLGIRMLWEVLRWDVTFQTVRLEGEPKLNDHWPPFYARLIQAQEPDLAGLFETRGRGTDGEVAP